MPRQIFVTNLERSANGDFSLSYVFWLATPASLVKPSTAITSAIPSTSVVSWGCKAAELAALQAGTVTERGGVSGLLPSTATIAQVGAGLLVSYTGAQAELNSRATIGKYIGTYYDSTGGWVLST